MIKKNGAISSANFYENGTESTYSITGSLTDNNGVFSGFSASNYITTNCSLGANSDKFELYGSYLTPSNVSQEQYVICTLTRNLAVAVVSNKFRLQVSSNNGGSWNYLVNGTTTISADTKYFYKVVSDNSNVRLYLSLNNGWILQSIAAISGTFTTTTLGFGNHLPTKVAPTLGYTDIKDYSVKVSGKEVWSGLDAYYLNSNPKINKNYIAGHVLQEI